MDMTNSPSIGVLGAGPIGLETALYARYLGYRVSVLEQGEVADHVRQWGHVKMFTPFSMNCSPLGLAALQAQSSDHVAPDADSLLTGQQWIDQYLRPLAESDLVADCVETGVRVLCVGRAGALKTDSTDDRAAHPFRLLIRKPDGDSDYREFDSIIDCSGTFGQATPLGSGGLPALGEQALSLTGRGDDQRGLYTHRIPDPATVQQLSGSSVAIIGSGYSAATNVAQLSELATASPGIQCFWITRQAGHADGPIRQIANDRLTYRRDLAHQANQLARDANWLRWYAGTSVRRIEWSGQQYTLQLEGENSDTISVDHVLANTGFQGDYSMLEPLALHRCYASGGPMAWAASLVGNTGDCLTQSSAGPDAVKTTEPGFYVIGSKSYGRDPRFLFSVGLEQIRDVFKLIAEREDLDLYESVAAALGG